MYFVPKLPNLNLKNLQFVFPSLFLVQNKTHLIPK